MTEVVEADLSEPSARKERFQYKLGEVIHLDRCPRLRGEDEFIRELCLAFGESLDEALVSEFEENLSELAAHVDAA